MEKPQKTAGKRRAPEAGKALAVTKTKPSPAPKAPAAAAPVWPEASRPSLMFLPDKIRGARSRRRATRRAAAGALGVLGITAIAYISVAAGTAGAASDLEKANDITAQHTRYLEEHAAVQDYYDGFILQRNAVSSILDGDMAYSKAVGALHNANTVGAVFTSIAKGDGTAACPNTDLFSPSAAVGCLEISGRVPAMGDVGVLVSSLNDSREFLAGPYLLESADGEGDATFRLTVGYTDKVFSFTGEKFRPTDEELASVSQAPAVPAAAATTEEAAQ